MNANGRQANPPPVFAAQANNYIYKLLDSKTDGKLVLLAFLNNGELNKKVRSELSRIVIEAEKHEQFGDTEVPGPPRESFTISRERFNLLARWISELFPGESAKYYYSPFQSAKRDGARIVGPRSGPRGTLYDQFRYTQRVLRNRGLLRRRNQQPEAVVAHDANENELNKLDWLKNHLDPHETVTQYWTETFAARRQLLKNNITIHGYYDSFPCLTVAQGADLLKSDFGRLYPNYNDTFFDRWEALRDLLVRKLAAVNLGDGPDKILITLLPTLLLHNKDAVIFYLLPHLIDGPAIRKRRNGDGHPNQGKLTVPERRNSFILHVETSADILPSLANRKEELRAAGLTFQPIVIFVGQLAAIEAAYVAVNDTKYKVDSALHAVDLCFRIYISLDCEYPKRAASLWLFIQKCCFNIHYNYDNCNRSLLALIGQVEQLFGNN